METAMQSLAEKFEFSVRWEPFLLRSNIPKEGLEKPPNTPDNPRVGARLKQAGEGTGIDFSGKSDRVPNTLPCHALMDYAKHKDGGRKQDDVAEALFQAYFTDGTPLDKAGLVAIAGKVGLDKGEASAFISDERNIEAAHESAKNWSRQGVTGVPYFYINGQRAFSGAQDASYFSRMFEVIAEKFPLDQSAPSHQGAAL